MNIGKLAKSSAAVIAAGAVTIGGVGAASAGTAKPVHGKEYFTLSQVNNTSKIIMHGLFTAYGTDVGAQESDVLKLNGGTLTINHPSADSSYTEQVDPLTCFATSTISGKYTVGSGTGKYAGVTGSGTYKGSFQAVEKRAKDNTCDDENDPSLGFGTITGSGPITLGVQTGGA